MRRLIALAGVLTAALAASAVPAFTADNGNVVVSITAQAPPAPCLTVTPGSVDFGTLPFSTIALVSRGSSDITVNNCGTAGQNLGAMTSNATGPSGFWQVRAFSGVPDPCVGTNQFYLELLKLSDPAVYLYLTGALQPMRALDGAPVVFPVGDQAFRLSFLMPCVGSNGAGETRTLSATFIASVP